MYKTKSGIRFSISVTKYFNNNEILVYKLLFLERNKKKGIMAKKFRNDEKFLEEQGRLLFLCFLKPTINGTGFYYVEPENDDSSRMDIIVNYHGKEYVIELKLWYGIEYEISGRDQIARYIAARNLSEGYLITFSFLKNKVVQEQPEWIEHEGKRIYEAVI